MDPLFSVCNPKSENLFAVPCSGDGPPPLTPQEFHAKVQTLLEDGATNHLSQDYVADQIFALAKSEPLAVQDDPTYQNFASIKTMVQDFQAEREASLNAQKMAILTDGTIQVRRFPNLEHGPLKEVKALVLHRTDSYSGTSTLNNLYSKTSTRSGAHFLIDKDGTIYQTVPLDKKAEHVGSIKPRCKQDLTCAPEEGKIIQSLKSRPKKLGRYETNTKPYPQRYPVNEDSLGIEVVGKHNPQTGFENITPQQKASLDKLVEALKTKYNLANTDIYAHTHISYKDNTYTEGTGMGYVTTPLEQWKPE